MLNRIPRRTVVVLLAFLSVFVCYIDRVNISVAIIPMAEDLGWSPRTQGTVLSSFFVGYLMLQIVGGRLADRFGGKIVLGVGVLLWSLFTVLTPSAALAGFGILLAARVAMGMGEALTFPSIYSIYGRWIPLQERSRAVGLTNSGIPLGTIFALVATPYIVERLGWEWAFYLFGAVGVLWFVAWQRLVTAEPSQHPRMRPEELALIEAGTPTVGGGCAAAAHGLPRSRADLGDHRRALLQQLVAVRPALVAAHVREQGTRGRLLGGGLVRDDPARRGLLFLQHRRDPRRPHDPRREWTSGACASSCKRSPAGASRRRFSSWVRWSPPGRQSP